MKRRGVLVGLVPLLGGAGCLQPARSTGPRTPPRSPEPTSTPVTGLVVVDFVGEPNDEGNLVVDVTVENRSGEARSGTVVVEVTAGDEETTVSTEVTVGANGRAEVSLPTDIPYDQFAGDGSLQVVVG